MKPTPLELLAPARDAETAIEAIRHGADAVYMGGPRHGARAAASNSIEDIRRVVDFATPFGAKVYVTLNTILYDSELGEAASMASELYAAGIDALIVQDMAFTSLPLPPIALHASTQCDIRNPRKAEMLEKAGFSQLVLARELSLDEIRAVRAVTTVPLEAFVHGALCVSYSGDCQASQITTGRSANRGECAQICRLSYDLLDADGRVIVADKHLLSLRDMNRMARLAEMADAGISSFKIEGRLKDISYVKTVVGAYRKALNAVIDASEGRYCRASRGRVEFTFAPDTSRAFNRGFTEYFLDGRPASQIKMASADTPKWVGRAVGKVKRIGHDFVEIDGDTPLSNGDGLAFFNADGQFDGFRAGRVDGRKVYPQQMPSLKPGTEIFRNHDKALNDLLMRPSASRLLDVDMSLRYVGGRLILDLDDDNSKVTVTYDFPDAQAATTPQEPNRKRNLEKLGNTPWRLRSLNDEVGGIFVPASIITELRRRGMESLMSSCRMTRRLDIRHRSTLSDDALNGYEADYHDNVANHKAREFYEKHGASVRQEAVEVKRPEGKIRVMTTRYCLRRELGACLRTTEGSKLKGPLRLRARGIEFTLDFDCKNCRMTVNR